MLCFVAEGTQETGFDALGLWYVVFFFFFLIRFAGKRHEGMGQIYQEYLTGPRIYKCSSCKAHAADHADIFSKSFNGRHGRAYLFNNVVNVCLRPKENRMLKTGLHVVADIYCNCCQQILGWKYEEAFEEEEKYKEGKYIIEKAKMTQENW